MLEKESLTRRISKMQMSFYVSKENLEETKRVIRSLDSLRFVHNPLEICRGREYNLTISGNVNDMNELNKYLSITKDKRLVLEP